MIEILSVSLPSNSLPLHCEAELGELPFAALYPPEYFRLKHWRRCHLREIGRHADGCTARPSDSSRHSEDSYPSFGARWFAAFS